MVFCRQCEIDLHNAIGYSKHIRESYVEGTIPLTEIIESPKKQLKVCDTHKQIIEIVCECSAFLCGQCTKSHR
jgi:hypothetical protein